MQFPSAYRICYKVSLELNKHRNVLGIRKRLPSPSFHLTSSLPSLHQHRACRETSQTQPHSNSLELTESCRQFSELHSTALVWSALVRKIISLNPASLTLISPVCQSLVALADL